VLSTDGDNFYIYSFISLLYLVQTTPLLLNLAGGPSNFQLPTQQPNIGYHNLCRLQRYARTEEQINNLCSLVTQQVLSDSQIRIGNRTRQTGSITRTI